MSTDEARKLCVPCYKDSSYGAEITVDYVAQENGRALEAWKELDIDNYISLAIRGRDASGTQRLGFAVTSWEDLKPGDTITIMNKVLVVQEKK